MMKLDNLTWREVEDYLGTNRQLIIPVGTCEQHGPHLPMNTDTLVAEKVAEYLSEKTGILVAPTLNYGVNLPCDRGYAGTCSATKESLRDFMASLLEWWREQGFARFFVLSAHGDIHHIEALRTSDPECVKVLELYDFDMGNILEKQKSARHAGEAETSMMMHLSPECVRTGQIQDYEPPVEDFTPYLKHEKTDPVDGSPGHSGYPSRASESKGEQVFSCMKEYALGWILDNKL